MQKPDLQALINGYLNGTLTTEALGQLHDLLFSAENKEAATAMLQVMIEDTPPVAGYDPAAWTNVRQQITAIDKSIDKAPVPTVHRVHFLKTRWFRYVAVLFVVLGLAMPLLYYTVGKQDQHNASTDLPPGSYRAVLQLASGKTIRLGQAAKGDLARQGNVRMVTLPDGWLQLLVDDQKADSVAAPGDNIITTPKGGQYQVLLSDGTRVWLNAGSALRFPTVFDGGHRTVQLSGEAYLEVAKEPNRPFQVKVGPATIEVLGTRFNINAYPEQGIVHTTLLEGKVRVKTAFREAVLLPGQQAVSRANDLSTGRVADPQDAVAWKNGYFRFAGADIRTVLQQVAHWYEVDVVYEQEVGPVHLSGEVPRSFTLQQVLKVLQESGVQLRLRNRTLYVSKSL